MYAKSKLIEKQIISESSYNEFFRYLILHHTVAQPEYYELLKKLLIGRYSEGYTMLTTQNSGNDKCWFINSGMVLGLKHQKNKKDVLLIFKAGEMAILPNSYFYDKPPSCLLMACPDTHLLEISNKDAQELRHSFPDARELANKIGHSNEPHFIERAELSSLPGKDKILEFHARYPDTHGPSRKIELLDTYKASYLNMSPSTFSKLSKQIYPEADI